MIESGIECVRCGRCCPNDCPNKIVDGATVTCVIHPSRVGNEARGGNLFCVLTPEDLWLRGIACQAVIWELNELDVTTELGKLLNNGQSVKVSEAKRRKIGSDILPCHSRTTGPALKSSTGPTLSYKLGLPQDYVVVLYSPKLETERLFL